MSAATAVNIRTFPHAHHAFDAVELPVVTEPASGPTVGYNPDAALQAWDVIHKFFKELKTPNKEKSFRGR